MKLGDRRATLVDVSLGGLSARTKDYRGLQEGSRVTAVLTMMDEDVQLPLLVVRLEWEGDYMFVAGAFMGLSELKQAKLAQFVRDWARKNITQKRRFF